MGRNECSGSALGVLAASMCLWTFCGARADEAWDFTKGFGESRWTSAAKIEDAACGATIKDGATVSVAVQLDPGLYELTLNAFGKGSLGLGVKQGNAESKRLMNLLEVPGTYGLLFEVKGSEKAFCDLLVSLKGERLTVADAAVKCADEEQKRKWKAAQDSFTMLGYYGVDPQRPAPGVKAVPMGSFSPEDVKKWEITEKAVYYDPDYDELEGWIKEPASLAAYFSSRGFSVRNAREMAQWMTEKVERKNAAGTSAVFVMGTAPLAVFNKPYDESPMAKYLKAGGRVVYLANAPLYTSQGEKGPMFCFGLEPEEQFLKLTTDRKTFYGMEGAVLSDAGKAWGLEPAHYLTRPVHNKNIAVPFVVDATGEYCGVGMVNLNPDFPLSGFIFVPDMYGPTKEALLRNAYRLACFSGRPVAVPDPVPGVEQQLPVDLSFGIGKDNLRFCYTRGEVVSFWIGAKSKSGKTERLEAELEVMDGAEVIARSTIGFEVGAQQADTIIGYLDTSGLKMAVYPVKVTLKSGSGTTRFDREVRIAPEPDHRGVHVGLWCGASPKMKRTDDLLVWLKERAIQPLFCDDLPIGRDLALWHGFSFSVRRHGESGGADAPPGTDFYRKSWDGQIMPIAAQGGKREAKGYANPFRRIKEAESFGKGINFDNKFPAFRKVAFTGDDYSQWFGIDYNECAVTGFRNLYGIEPPKPPEIEKESDLAKVKAPAPGIIPDNDPWILLNRYWSEQVHGDMARRLAKAMRDNSDGVGKVGQVSGGMMIPVMQMWAAMYPPFNMGANGYNLTSFYYYNSLWQPPLAHWWWLECARMGARGQEQWIMPDCVYEGTTPALYNHFGWLMLAGGATGMNYFCSDEKNPGSVEAMSMFGKLADKYGLLLAAVKPVRKKVGFLIPFEQITYKVTSCFEMAYPYMDMLMAHVDVEPVSPEELTRENIGGYEAIVVARTNWLKQSAADLLADFARNGGTVIVDSESAKGITIPGATHLAVPLGGTSIGEYGKIDKLKHLKETLGIHVKPVVECDNPFIVFRRCAGDNMKALWVNHVMTDKEYTDLRAITSTKLDEKNIAGMKYGKEEVAAMVSVPDDGTIPFDVFSGKALVVERKDGKMSFNVSVPKWDGKLLAFLPELPAGIAVDAPPKARPGIAAPLSIVVKGTSGTVKTLVPLQITVRDPKGKPSVEYSRRILAKDGIAGCKFTFAVNDIPGIWTVEVQDVMTGVKNGVKLELAARP